MNAPQVIVVGDCMLDRLVTVELGDFNPEEDGAFRYQFARQEEFPGGAANVAMNVKALGATVTLIGAAGYDDDGCQLASKLLDAGVTCRMNYAGFIRTTVKTRFRNRAGTLLRVDRDHHLGGEFAVVLADLLATQLALQQPPPIVVFSDYGKGVLADMRPFAPILDRLNGAMAVYLVDPPRSGLWAPLGGPAALFKPNLKQAQLMIHRAGLDSALHDLGPLPGHFQVPDRCLELARLLKTAMARMKVRSRFIWLTLGPAGSVVGITDLDDSWQYIPAYQALGYDVTGAGDTAIAALATYMAKEVTWRYSWSTILAGCDFASRAAAVAVDRIGTAAVTPQEIDRVTVPMGYGQP